MFPRRIAQDKTGTRLSQKRWRFEPRFAMLLGFEGESRDGVLASRGFGNH